MTQAQASEPTVSSNAVRRSPREIEDLPHPPGLPIVGNGHQLSPQALHLRLEAWAELYGCPFRADVVSNRFVHFDSPEAVDQVLRSRPENFSRFHKIERLTRELHTFGVFSSEGEEWKAQRRLAMVALAQRNLRGFYGTLRTVAERLRRRWLLAADQGTTLDFLEEVMLFTVDVTSTLAFGRDTNTIESSSDRIQQHLAHVFPKLQSRMIAVLPYWRYFRLPSDRRLERSLRELDTWIAELIEETRQKMAAHPALAEEPENLLQAMLTSRRTDGQPFSDTEVSGNVMTMLLAGEDTTANTLSWTVHELLDHPDVLAEVKAEVDRTLTVDSIPEDMGTLDQLKLTSWSANEALRLRAVVPAMASTTLKETVVDGIRLTPGTHVTLMLRRLSTSPDFISRSKEFLPNRWGQDGLAEELRRRGIYVPFGSGPRICPGRALALLEIRLVLGMLLKEFELERVGLSEDVSEHLAFTMAPRGLRVRLHRRS